MQYYVVDTYGASGSDGVHIKYLHRASGLLAVQL